VIAVDGLASERYQQVYSSSGLAGLDPILVTGINFRPDPTFGSAFSFTPQSVRIDLSTTSAGPDSLDPAFAANIGAGNTTVFATGPLTLFSSFSGPPGGPRDFSIHIGFAASFLYDASKGNLLLDVRNFGGGPDPAGLNAAFDAQQTTGDSVSRVFTYTGAGVSSPAGMPDTAGLVTQFEFASVPEPQSWLTVAAGIWIMSVIRYGYGREGK
jgi:hypothetical protein